MPQPNFFKSLKKYVWSKASAVSSFSKFFNAGIASYVMFGPASLIEFICTTGICWLANDAIKALVQAGGSNPIRNTRLSLRTGRSTGNLSSIKNSLFLLASLLPLAAAIEDKIYFAKTSAPNSTSQTVYCLELNDQLTPYVFRPESQAYFPCPIHNFTQLLTCLADVCGNITTVFPWLPPIQDFKEVAYNFEMHIGYLWLLVSTNITKVANSFAGDQNFYECLLKFIDEVIEKPTSDYLKAWAIKYGTAYGWLTLISVVALCMGASPIFMCIVGKMISHKIKALKAEREYQRNHPDAEHLEGLFHKIQDVAPAASKMPRELTGIIASYLNEMPLEIRIIVASYLDDDSMVDLDQQQEQKHNDSESMEALTAPLLGATVVDMSRQDDEKDEKSTPCIYAPALSVHGLDTDDEKEVNAKDGVDSSMYYAMSP